jgi:hypothetical protein
MDYNIIENRVVFIKTDKILFFLKNKKIRKIN